MENGKKCDTRTETFNLIAKVSGWNIGHTGSNGVYFKFYKSGTDLKKFDYEVWRDNL